jgi:hypothetical protein
MMKVNSPEDVRDFIRTQMEANLRASVSNMRKATLSDRHIERFIADHKVQVEKECGRVVAMYERLKANPDAVSLATN